MVVSLYSLYGCLFPHLSVTLHSHLSSPLAGPIMVDFASFQPHTNSHLNGLTVQFKGLSFHEGTKRSPKAAVTRRGCCGDHDFPQRSITSHIVKGGG
ncbi:hypothetical protein TNIN_451281 [Trichonephila inaurata madagascariensis]|uniref:Uncharacterized protein n=1 Tax=Trichonephila inaurata madagascariensis TaxID=2747483 RepID=A0A8X7CSW6_9ARAC|nr:hypothetical protein TNIN_451281 [Trichonephila inaurata madagascariensis]